MANTTRAKCARGQVSILLTSEKMTLPLYYGRYLLLGMFVNASLTLFRHCLIKHVAYRYSGSADLSAARGVNKFDNRYAATYFRSVNLNE